VHCEYALPRLGKCAIYPPTELRNLIEISFSPRSAVLRYGLSPHRREPGVLIRYGWQLDPVEGASLPYSFIEPPHNLNGFPALTF
jgi:hypothetical protein